MAAEDGKQRLTDVAKAESIKLCLAKVGYERIKEMVDPEIALNRSRELRQKHGRSAKWIERRMLGQETLNKLTDYGEQKRNIDGS
jgi:hypothetical protein